MIELQVGTCWAFCPKHWSRRGTVEALAGYLKSSCRLREEDSCPEICPQWCSHYCRLAVECDVTELMNLPADNLALFWLDLPMQNLRGGGRGEHEEGQLGKAVHHVRKLQVRGLCPQHLRLLLLARPKLMDEILRIEDAQKVRRALFRQAKRVQLPWKDEDGQPAAQQPKPPSSPKQKERQPKEGKGKPAVAAAAAVEKTTQKLPVLFDADWPVPIVHELYPGQQGIQLAQTMEEATRIVERMKHAKGKAALISLDRVPGVTNVQQQMTVSLGVRRGQALTVKSSLAWLVQLGSEAVHPRNVAPEITLEPKSSSTLVTAVVVDKHHATAALIKEVEARDLTKLRKRFEEIIGREVGSQLDLFRLRDEGSHFFMLVRFPQNSLEDMMKASGRDGLFIRTPKDKVTEYKVLWLPGDAGRSLTVALAFAFNYGYQRCQVHISSAGTPQTQAGTGKGEGAAKRV